MTDVIFIGDRCHYIVTGITKGGFCFLVDFLPGDRKEIARLYSLVAGQLVKMVIKAKHGLNPAFLHTGRQQSISKIYVFSFV